MIVTVPRIAALSISAFLIMMMMPVAAQAGLFGLEMSVSAHSGSRNNPYVEEPLTPMVKKYEDALTTSNGFIEALKNGDYQKAYSDFTDEKFRQKSTVDDLFTYHASAMSSYGQIKEYKPMQWAFKTATMDGEKFVLSRKIVEHEKGRLIYVFTFVRQGPYNQLRGLSILEMNSK